MHPPGERTAPPSTAVRWRIVALLAGFSLTSYLLRTNISIAAKFMMPDLGLTQVQIGRVFSAFMFGYAIFQAPAGALGDWFGPRRVLAWSAVVWGVATVLTGAIPGVVGGGAAAYASLIAIRFLLGAAEASTYPVAAATVSTWMPLSERAFANSLVIAGMALGSAFSAPLIAWVMTTGGWRLSFYLTSLLAFAIAALWWWQATDAPEQHPWIGREELRLIGTRTAIAGDERVPWTTLLRNRNVALMCASYLLDSYVLFMFVFWFFLYLVNERHFSVLSGGAFSSLPWIAALIMVPTAGYVCDVLSTRFGRRWGRRLVAMTGLAGSSALVAAGAHAQSPYVAIGILAVSVGFLISTEGPFWSGITDVSGSYAGTAGGIMNTAGNGGGVISTLLVPVLVDRFGWTTTFGIASGLGLIAALLWCFVRVDERINDGVPTWPTQPTS